MAKKNKSSKCKIFFLRKDLKTNEENINKWLESNTIEIDNCFSMSNDQLIIFYKGFENGESERQGD